MDRKRAMLKTVSAIQNADAQKKKEIKNVVREKSEV